MPDQRTEVPAQSIFTLPENMNPIAPPAEQTPASISGDKDFLEKMMRTGEQQIAEAAARAGAKAKPDITEEEWLVLEELLEKNYGTKEYILFEGRVTVRFKTLVNKEHTDLAAMVREKATKENYSEPEIVTMMTKGMLALSLQYVTVKKKGTGEVINTPFVEYDLEKKLEILDGYTIQLTDILIAKYNEFNRFVGRLMETADFVKK
jgi:hypothetical protein